MKHRPPHKIVMIGPESTGKTTLSRQLAAHYQAPWVAEYARQYIDALPRPYEEQDLLAIAHGQCALEDQQTARATQWLFCDTDLQVIEVWAKVKYGRVAPWIIAEQQRRKYAHYFLCGIDVPWEYDPQREHPQAREALFAAYQQLLMERQLPFTILSGDPEARLQQAVDVLTRLDFAQ